MLNKKINIYCSNSYETFEKEYPWIKNQLLDYDSEHRCPRGIKEISEYFMKMLNSEDETINIYTISDIPLNIMSLLIAEGLFNYKNVKIIFVGVEEDTKKLIRFEAGYTVEGFGDINWPLGVMSSFYGFYLPGKHLLYEKDLKNCN